MSNLSRLSLLIIFMTSSLWASLPEAQIRYNLEDLKILSKSKNYKEFFAHYIDIRPSERKQEWQKLVIENAIGYLKESMKLKTFSKAELLRFSELKRIELLQDNEVYSLYFNDFAAKYFDQCKSNIENLESDCYQTIKSFWLNSKKDKDLGLKIGSFLYKKFSKEQAKPNILNQFWTYFHPAVESESADLFCKKPHVSQVVQDKLFYEFSQTPNFKPDFTLFSRKCWNVIEAQMAGLLFSENEFNRIVAVKTFEALKEIKPIHRYINALYYILDSPRKGKNLNKQWSLIENLKNDSTMREELIEVVKKRALLPDKIFAHQDSKLVKAIINVLNRNFPEYLDLYTKKCKQFYTAQVEFPLGNPTMYCRALKSQELYIKLDTNQQNNINKI